jgi:hypothetical protein
MCNIAAKWLIPAALLLAIFSINYPLMKVHGVSRSGEVQCGWEVEYYPTPLFRGANEEFLQSSPLRVSLVKRESFSWFFAGILSIYSVLLLSGLIETKLKFPKIGVNLDRLLLKISIVVLLTPFALLTCSSALRHGRATEFCAGAFLIVASLILSTSYLIVRYR